MSEVPTPLEMSLTVDRAAEDPMAANIAIADGYFRFSNRLGQLLHPDAVVSDRDWDRDQWPRNATFATFAAWSAISLRVEVGPNGARRESRLSRRLYGVAARRFLSDHEIALNIAFGQGAIYAEIGSALHRFLTLIDDGDTDPHERDENWDRLGDRLSEDNIDLTADRRRRAANLGYSPEEAIGPLEWATLQQALWPYFLVWSLDGTGEQLTPKQRAELILAGNLRLVAYEQRRLQPILERNLGFLPNAVRTEIAHRVFGYNTPLRRDLLRHLRLAGRVTELGVEAYEIAATRHVFSMVVGDEEVRFGRDLPLSPPANPVLRNHQLVVDQDRYAERRFFPLELLTLETRTAWNEWERHDDSSGQGFSTGVDNWLRYSERLSFIASLFRSRQQLSALYKAPRTSVPDAFPSPARIGADTTASAFDRPSLGDLS